MNESVMVNPTTNEVIATLRVMRTKNNIQIYCKSEALHNIMNRFGNVMDYTSRESNGVMYRYYDIRRIFNDAVFDDPYISVGGLNLSEITSAITQDSPRIIRRSHDRSEVPIWIPQLKILLCTSLNEGCIYTCNSPCTTDGIEKFVMLAETIIVWLYNTFCADKEVSCRFKVEESRIG